MKGLIILSNTENNPTTRKGGISVKTEHIFPVIKKWLYSEKEIFLRELVSNASDAVTKLKRLASLGEITLPDDEAFAVTVTLDEEAKTLTVSDNGIGMTADEVEKYIGNIALSGAVDFIEQYEKGDNAGGIIGHFGLGFYSAFMVADTVEIITKSYQDAPAVHWVLKDNGEYEATPYEDEKSRGTDIVLHLNEEGSEYAKSAKLREVLDKYCAFMPVEIYLVTETDTEEEEDKPNEPINDTTPLWLKTPSECTDEEYKEFYQKVFRDYREPLFQIHLSADYPLNFKGILYFPAIKNEYESLEGQVKLYYNQVFVADNIKEVIPEYLLLLRGVLDCPELPLNVSRSYLQNSGYVTKIANHITKKVADKLVSLCNNERERYEGFWKDIKIFAEYGALRDKKFFERVKGALLLELSDGKYKTLDEYLNTESETPKDTVYYATDPVAQAQYIKLFEDRGIEVAILSHTLDMQFISLLEDDKKIKFSRVDSSTDALKKESEVYENEEMVALFRKVSGKDDLKVSFEALNDEATPALLTVSEEDRRFADMMKMYGNMFPQGMERPESTTLVLNQENALIRRLAEVLDTPLAETCAKQIYSLATLAQRSLTADELRDFLLGSYDALKLALN
ncbi:MAG: molecular chaperone HtpG [Clostridia bacterium]|nr:molecular chaperone HtpG [Clostridia bacterium]